MPSGIYKRTAEQIEKLVELAKRNSPFKKGRAHYFYGKPSPVLGKHWILSEETKEKLSLIRKGKQYTLGHKLTKEHKRKISEANMGHPPYYIAIGKENPTWKGNHVKYRGLHTWVQRWLGNPMKCQYCGVEKTTPKSIHWANKSRRYFRNLTDWISLCVSCHKRYDRELISP